MDRQKLSWSWCEPDQHMHGCNIAGMAPAGMNGQSTVREVDLETGKVLRKKHLSRADFGEGLTKFKDRWAASPTCHSALTNQRGGL